MLKKFGFSLVGQFLLAISLLSSKGLAGVFEVLQRSNHAVVSVTEGLDQRLRFLQFSNWTEIARQRDRNCPNFEIDSDQICAMTQIQAIEYCRARGQRLPSVQELAELATNMGARGLRNSAARGFSRIEGSDEIMPEAQNFYFGREGYLGPGGEFEDRFLWSSTFVLGDETKAYYLDLYFGGIFYGSRTNPYGDSAVRCVGQ